MGGLTRVLAGLLGYAARLLPPGRRQWAEAVGAEAGEVAAGWPRLRWLAGGVWLVAREATMARKVVYWLGAGAVAAAAGWVVWLSWHTSAAADAQTVTDRVRVLAGAAALVVLPWVGRRRGWFGPVGSSITARLVRVAGCAGVCGLGVAVVRMDSHLGRGPHGPGPFSLPREIAALVLVWRRTGSPGRGQGQMARCRSQPAVGNRRDCGSAGVLCRAAPGARGRLRGRDPRRDLAAVAGNKRLPRRRHHHRPGRGPGHQPGHLRTSELLRSLCWPLVLGMLALIFLLAALAGMAAAWLLPDTGDPQELWEARGLQGALAGSVAGAVCGLLLTNLFVVAVFMMVLGPLVGAGGGAAGGFIAADHPPRSQPARSWAAGLFVRF